MAPLTAAITANASKSNNIKHILYSKIPELTVNPYNFFSFFFFKKSSLVILGQNSTPKTHKMTKAQKNQKNCYNYKNFLKSPYGTKKINKIIKPKKTNINKKSKKTNINKKFKKTNIKQKTKKTCPFLVCLIFLTYPFFIFTFALILFFPFPFDWVFCGLDYCKRGYNNLEIFPI